MRLKKNILISFIGLLFLAIYLGYLVFRKAIMQEDATKAEDMISETQNSHPDWQTFVDAAGMFTFRYPEAFGGNVWRPVAWPPRITEATNSEDAIVTGCPNYQAAESNNPSGTNGISGTLPYKLFRSAGVGAGNLYDEFCFIYIAESRYYAMSIEINSHTACGQSCGAYCGTEYELECATLNRERVIEEPIREIAESFRMIK